jgi:AcrR family transcriptional regulator
MRAFEKLYEQHGMKGVSSAAVAKEAGYSRSSFYRTFDSVYDLLEILELRAVPTREFRYLVDNANTITMK